MNLRKFFLYLLIISVVVSALLGIGVVLFGDFGDIEVRVLSSPPYEGGVAAASADGVVLASQTFQTFQTS